MYRTFLSWRYLVTRRANFIGVMGIFVAVGALILILSIMTGFLDMTRQMIRGGLSDLVVTPFTEGQLREPAEELLAVARRDPRVVAASARLVWWGMLGQGGDGTHRTERLFSDPAFGGQGIVEMVGVDVATPVRALDRMLALWLPQLGLPYRPATIQDELDTTGLLAALQRAPLAGRRSAPVQDPLLPFALPSAAREREGRPLEAVLVGERLFHTLRLTRGEELELATVVPDLGGNLAQSKRRFVVAGTFRTQDNDTDGRRLYLDRRVLADFLNLRSGDDRRLLDYTEIVVKVADYQRDAGPLKRELSEALLGAGLIEGDREFGAYEGQVRTWEDFRQSLLGAIQNERVLMAIMLSLILVVAGFTIFSILTMMVIEKRRDIGILSALGATRRGILATFLLIGFWNALLGTSLGALAGIQGARHIDAIERWLSSQIGYQIFDRSVYYFDEIPARIEPAAVAWIVLGAFACTLLFAAIPAWRAGRLDPLAALRYE